MFQATSDDIPRGPVRGDCDQGGVYSHCLVCVTSGLASLSAAAPGFLSEGLSLVSRAGFATRRDRIVMSLPQYAFPTDEQNLVYK